ncbi:MAG: C40 family peptidase [Mycobacteriales bacterium]
MATPMRRAGARLAVFVTSVTMAVSLLPTASRADNLGGLAAQIAAARARLAALQTQTEAATEAYDAGQIALAGAMNRAQVAQTAAAAAATAQNSLSNQLSEFAAAAYEGADNGALQVLASGGPQAFLDRASSLSAFSAREESLLGDFTAAHQQQQETAIAAAQAQAAQQQAAQQLAAQKLAILASVTQEQRLLSQLQAEQQRLVAEAQAAAAAARAAAAHAAAERAAQLAAQEEAALAAEAAATASARANFSSQPLGPPPSPPAASGSGGPATAVAWARAELGKPYEWGAAGPNSFDCSGLTQFVWAKAGVYLAHYTGDQWNEGVQVAVPEPGDLVFFGSNHYHVGIYVGNGDMIDAPHSGAYVREEPLWSDYSGAVRVG